MAHEGLWERLLTLEHQETAQRAKCQYMDNPERYIVKLLNTEYVVNLSNKQISSIKQETSFVISEFIEQLCILAYLINAQDLSLADKLVKAEALPGGQFFFRGLHSLPTAKLEKAFGDCPELLHRIAKQLDAKCCEFGDASIEFYVLPRVPLTIVIWKKDEQFQARASILFDQTAASHLPLDALWAAVNLAVNVLVNLRNSMKDGNDNMT
jgi:hypothetical protein